MTDVLLVSNGTILTMDPAQPEVEAFGVIGDRIVAVGNRRLVEDALPRGYRTRRSRPGAAPMPASTKRTTT